MDSLILFLHVHHLTMSEMIKILGAKLHFMISSELQNLDIEKVAVSSKVTTA